MNLMTTAMTMRGWRRDLFLRAAGGKVPPSILERMREIVRADITQQDEDRLRDKAFRGSGFQDLASTVDERRARATECVDRRETSTVAQTRVQVPNGS